MSRLSGYERCLDGDLLPACMSANKLRFLCIFCICSLHVCSFSMTSSPPRVLRGKVKSSKNLPKVCGNMDVFWCYPCLKVVLLSMIFRFSHLKNSSHFQGVFQQLSSTFFIEESHSQVEVFGKVKESVTINTIIIVETDRAFTCFECLAFLFGWKFSKQSHFTIRIVLKSSKLEMLQKIKKILRFHYFDNCNGYLCCIRQFGMRKSEMELDPHLVFHSGQYWFRIRIFWSRLTPRRWQLRNKD